ncbi:MAG TPA: N,N-dimethylformamidase beta subunit family domain-containing protein [Verrucomicrobiales bacterium]|nr:N,N-dimethylformamidase beta subunit family domain-containing protein [Verrucomicrobiales bacterium]
MNPPALPISRRRAIAGGLLTAGGISPALAQEPRPLFVEGYATQVSYAPGEEAKLCVSTTGSAFSVEITRIGAKAERVWSKDNIPGREHPVPDNASSHGCRWPVSVSVKIPAEWRSGYYLVTLRTQDGGGGFIQRNRRTAEGRCWFVVRSGGTAPRSKMLLQLSANTYNAYNNWGGFSLYGYNGRNGNQGHRVSFDRPPESQFPNWEQPFVEWGERNGIAMDFAANSDLEFHPEELDGRKLVLSVGHDEYWSKPMRDNLEKFIGSGGNVAFFSGNVCCWQVRSEDNGRALTSWKQNYHSDPVYAARKDLSTLSSLWSHHLIKRPENSLTGVCFLWGGYHRSHGQLMDGSGAFTVHRPDHWIFAGTGLKKGDAFGGKDTIVGYECDGCELEMRDGLPFPTHRDGTPDNFEIAGTAPAIWHPDDCEWYDKWENGRKGNAVLGTYRRGGTVFTCGSTDWSHGLRGADPAVERITRNVIEKLGV